VTDPHSSPVTAAPGADLDPTPGEWQRVSPKQITVDIIGNLVALVIVTAGTALPWILSGVTWLAVIPAASLVIFVLVLVFTPRRIRAIGYLLRDDDLVFRTGIMFKRQVAVPYGRMQQVDVTRGPLERSFGLSSLKLITAAAATNITIPGLPEAEAERLRDHLVEVAETRRAGL
jgi:uncharacterized protein